MKVYVLFENGSDGKAPEECLIGVTTNEEFATRWRDKDMEYRETQEFELDKIPCEECGGEWSIPK